MKIEHFAYQVNDAFAVADWYTKNLGFSIKRSAKSPVPVCFLADGAGDVMIEIYNNPTVNTPDYASMDPLVYIWLLFATPFLKKLRSWYRQVLPFYQVQKTHRVVIL